MDFESPDVEREFPGLYASESGSGKRSQESDFSDEAHDKSTKKELLIGKRKDKKESKKDQGYAALEGESSPEEEVDVKSPCKSKKSKSFKFPTIKEKREKSREKDVKEKDKDREKDRDKDIDRDKEKKKELKSKLKLKDKRKVKASDDSADCSDEMPVFGVPLCVAIDRSHCHDGIGIPVVVRDCIDYVEECGLGVEGIYKVSGVKSKVQLLRKSYNKRETVKLHYYDSSTVTSLLKTFLRELPDPLLTADLLPRIEDAVNLKESSAREQELSALLKQLPLGNLTCLSWFIRHLANVAANESVNKMSVNALGITLGPVLQTSPRVLTALVLHCGALFPNVKLIRYIPPLSAGCTSLPDSRESIVTELAKQDSLLNQIHSEMNHGCTTRSDQLWEVQRFITQLKRKLRTLEKAVEVPNQAHDELNNQPLAKTDQTIGVTLEATKAAVSSPVVDDKIDFQLQVAADEVCLKGGTRCDSEDIENTSENRKKTVSRDEADASASGCIMANSESLPPTQIGPAPVTVQNPADVPSSVPASSPSCILPETTPTKDQTEQGSGSESIEEISERHLYLEQMELLKLHAFLISRISEEREEIETLRMEVSSLSNSQQESTGLNVTPENTDVPIVNENPDITANDSHCKDEKERKELTSQNLLLMQERLNYVKQIMYEHEACISLRVQLGLQHFSESR